MENNKNTIIAIALMLVVWVGFSFFFPARQPVSSPPPETIGKAEKTIPPPQSSAPAMFTEPAAPLDTLVSKETVSGEEKRIIVDHPFYRAIFSNIGARLVSFELKNYAVSPRSDAPPVNLVVSGGSLTTAANEMLSLPADAFFSVSLGSEGLQLDADEKAQLVFTTTLATGLIVEKRYSFQGNAYQFDLDVALRNGTPASKSGSLSLALVTPQAGEKKTDSEEFIGATTLTNGEIEKVALDKLDDAIVYSPPIAWTAFGDKYFISAVIPQADAVGTIRLTKSKESVRNIIETPDFTLLPGESLVFHYLLYFGPRDLDILQQVGHNLSEAVDFGFFAFIAKPLLTVLKFFYKFLGNYGLAIILLTVIIKLLFWPLTQKSYTSMKAMQKLQPEMQKIREKHGKDKERLNREIMEMYKTHRVNPLGGCLPMLVQIPVFFALYKVLMEGIEVRHAPFYLWITDLSAKDPYYITPLIMGGTMFIQQKMTPTTMDPMQAKLFMLMPVIFTFMFLNFPSGLVIYWLINNLLTIGQQYLINRRP